MTTTNSKPRIRRGLLPAAATTALLSVLYLTGLFSRDHSGLGWVPRGSPKEERSGILVRDFFLQARCQQRCQNTEWIGLLPFSS